MPRSPGGWRRAERSWVGIEPAPSIQFVSRPQIEPASTSMASDNPLHPIPSPPRKFMIGNMLSVRADAPIQDMMQLSRELGPIFWLDMMGKPMVVVSGFDLVDELSDEARFEKSTRGVLRKLRPVAHGLFTADTQEPRWSQVAQHPAADLRAARHAGLPRRHARYRRSVHDEVGAAQRRRRDRRHRRHDARDARHHRPVRLRLSLQFVLPRRQPSRSSTPWCARWKPPCRRAACRWRTSINPQEQRQLRDDTRYMHDMVEDLIKARRMHEDASKKDLLNYMLAGVDKQTGPAPRRHPDPRRDHHLPDRRPRDHQRPALVRRLRPAEPSRGAGEGLCGGRRVLGPDTSAKPTYQQVNQLNYIAPDPEGDAAAVADRARLRHSRARRHHARRQVSR